MPTTSYYNLQMSATGKNCMCGRPIDSCSDNSEDFYCSLYCRRFDSEKWDKVPLSDSKHHTNHPLKYPPIPQSCDMCGDIFDLYYGSVSKGNRSRFCSKDCFYELVTSTRNAKKKWIMLRILDQRGPLTGSELGAIMDKYDTKGNGRVVGSTMRYFVSKKWVTRTDAELSNKRVYELVFTGPIGHMIHPEYTARYK